MNLEALLQHLGLEVPPNITLADIQVSSITCDSREVKSGTVFFALPGTHEHGNRYIKTAFDNGALVCVTNFTPNFSIKGNLIVADHVRTLYAKACAHFYQPQPAHAVAVTGTNGKTSVVNFIQQFWQAAGLDGAALGTVGLKTAKGLQKGTLTSPEPGQLHRSLKELKQKGIDYIALEASSHGLDQHRLEGVDISVAGFTNFSRDHLDYHPTEQAYFEAKLRLFSKALRPDGVAVIYADDARSASVVKACEKRGLLVLTVGEAGQYIKLIKAEPTPHGQSALIKWRRGDKMVSYQLDVPLIGRFQLDNILVAMAMAEATGVAVDQILNALHAIKGVKGRLELVAHCHGVPVFVDYAHTPEALENVLANLRPHTSGALHIVFGAGGDRDPGKRILMGQAAQKGADRIIITDDNPRTEEPSNIREAVLAGAPGAHEQAGRAQAIQSALDSTKKGDVVLIAGKGHENYQIVGTQKTYFSDHDEILRHKGSVAAP